MVKVSHIDHVFIIMALSECVTDLVSSDNMLIHFMLVVTECTHSLAIANKKFGSY